MKLTIFRPAAAAALILFVASCDATFSGNNVEVPIAGASAAPGAAPDAPGATPTPSATIAPTQKVIRDITIQPDNFVIEEGTAMDAIVVVSYTDGTFDTNVTWSSSDATVLSVNPTTGRLTALKQGVASLVAQSPVDKAKKATSTVSVRPAPVTTVIARVAPSEATIKVGQTIQLAAELQLSNGRLSPNVIWQSTNTTLASVTRGLVTGLKPGTVTITATAQDEATKMATAVITITE